MNRENTTPITPYVDIFEDDDGVTLQADLPGVTREGLSIEVEGETLRLQGEVKTEERSDWHSLHTEVVSTHYQREFTLGSELNSEAIEASMKNGVLNLRIPRRQHSKPRRVEVRFA